MDPIVNPIFQTPQFTPKDLTAHSPPSLNASAPVWRVSREWQSLVSSLRDADEQSSNLPSPTSSPSHPFKDKGNQRRRQHRSGSPPMRGSSLTDSSLTPSSWMGSSSARDDDIDRAIGLGLSGIPDLPGAYRGEKMVNAAVVSQDIPLKRVFKPRKSFKSLRQREAAFPVRIATPAPSLFSLTGLSPATRRRDPPRTSFIFTKHSASRQDDTIAAITEIKAPYLAYVPRIDDGLPFTNEEETLNGSESELGEVARDLMMDFTPHKPTLDTLLTPPRSLRRTRLELPCVD